MKYAIVILDGAADEPIEMFGGRTVLEAAHTPNLDALGRAGTCGLSRNVPEGFEPSSNVACMSILGYSPERYDIGRGAIEGAALGIELQPGDVALRVNLANVADGIMRSYSSGNITTDDSHALALQIKDALDDDRFELTLGAGFRHILRIRDCPALLDLVYHPAHNLADQPIAGYWPHVPGDCDDEAHRDAACLIRDWMGHADEILADSSVNDRREKEGLLRANTAWVFWPGTKPDGMESFENAFGIRAGMISPVDLLNGLAELTGMCRYTIDGLTDGPGNDYAGQGVKAVEMLGECDLVVVHVEAPDTYGHDGEPELKRESIELIDEHIVSRLIEYGGGNDLRILALPDHPTPVRLKTHANRPVPFVLSGPGIGKTAGNRLTEVDALESGTVVDPGCDLMKMLLG